MTLISKLKRILILICRILLKTGLDDLRLELNLTTITQITMNRYSLMSREEKKENLKLELFLKSTEKTVSRSIFRAEINVNRL